VRVPDEISRKENEISSHGVEDSILKAKAFRLREETL